MGFRLTWLLKIILWTQKKIRAGSFTKSETSGTLNIIQDMRKDEDGEAEIRPRLWGLYPWLEENPGSDASRWAMDWVYEFDSWLRLQREWEGSRQPGAGREEAEKGQLSEGLKRRRGVKDTTNITAIHLVHEGPWYCYCEPMGPQHGKLYVYLCVCVCVCMCTHACKWIFGKGKYHFNRFSRFWLISRFWNMILPPLQSSWFWSSKQDLYSD